MNGVKANTQKTNSACNLKTLKNGKKYVQKRNSASQYKVMYFKIIAQIKLINKISIKISMVHWAR